MKISLGFVPLADCAPLVVAHQKGFFAREGLDVELKKIQEWPLLLRRLQDGGVDGAHMLATLPVLAATGAPGIEVPLCTAWVLSTCGNAITLSNRLCREEVSDATSLSRWLSANPSEVVRLGIVLARSTQELTLREWLQQGGLEVGQRIELVECPPQEMVRRLREGLIDGFCSGEPWNQRATSSKLGGIVALGDSILPDMPEKVLAVRRGWHLRERNAHAAMLRAIDAASIWLTEPAHVDEAAGMLASKYFVNTREALLRSALARQLQAGWNRTLHSEGFLRFSGMNAPNRSGFQSILERLVWWGHLPSSALDADLGEVCLEPFHEDVFCARGNVAA